MRWSALFLALAWVGYFAPWAPHRVAALNLSGFDLAEWVTFLPGVRDGSLSFDRLHFLAPLAALAVLSPLVALRARFNHAGMKAQSPALYSSRVTAQAAVLGGSFPAPGTARRAWMPEQLPSRLRVFVVGAGLAGFIGAAAILPPYPLTLSAASDPELRPQLLLGLLALGGWLAGLTARRWPSAAAGLAQSVLALVGLGFAAWAFPAARPVLAELHNAPVGVGWGWIATLLGFAGLALKPRVSAGGTRQLPG